MTGSNDRPSRNIVQIALVTRDMGKALDYHVSQLGIGPWIVADSVKIENAVYRGEPVTLDVSVALANSGAMQFEIIQPNDDSPSLWREFLARSPLQDQVQHMALAAWDYDACFAEFADKGFAVLQSGGPADGRFCYLHHPANPDFTLEIVEMSDARRALWDTVARAAQDWDGQDPIRARPST
jgi:hypothetical protein